MKKQFTLVFILLCWALTSAAQKFEVDTLVYNGSSDKHINFVFLGDGYKESEFTKYSSDVESTVAGIFSKSPFKEHKSYFNVFAIKVPSKESGASHPGNARDEAPGSTQPITTVDNYFGSTFDYAGIHRLLVPTKSDAITSVLATNFPEYDQVIILVNSPYYGGSGGAVSISSTHVQSKEITIHELGHSFAGLADEYWAGANYAREKPNMTQESSRESVKWKKWLDQEEVGIYSHEESPNWFRPHQRCNMRFLSSPDNVIEFCKVCSASITEQIFALVNISTKPIVPGTITGSTDLCPDQSESTYSINEVQGASNYIWSLPTGFTILSGQGTTSVRIKAGNISGTISVVANNIYGSSPASNLEVSVKDLPKVDAGTNQSLCIDAGIITLSGFTPADGTWSGRGITADGKFDPAIAGAGQHTLTYSFSQYGCTVSANKTMTVTTKPSASLSAFNVVCSTSTDFTLTGGQPAGGTYSGAFVTNGVFNAAAAGAGTHTITYTYTSNGCTAVANQELTVGTCTGINEDEIATGIKVYPNPTNSIVHIEATLTGSSEATIQVYDFSGKLVYKEIQNHLAGELMKGIDLKGNAKGLYLICIITNKGVVTRKLLLN